MNRVSTATAVVTLNTIDHYRFSLRLLQLHGRTGKRKANTFFPIEFMPVAVKGKVVKNRMWEEILH